MLKLEQQLLFALLLLQVFTHTLKLTGEGLDMNMLPRQCL